LGLHVRDLVQVSSLISDCAQKVAGPKKDSTWEKEGWFDVSTTKEPYRVEGKKTMGYEVAEQLGWRMHQGSSARFKCQKMGRRGLVRAPRFTAADWRRFFELRSKSLARSISTPERL
jgi:hypothetical protein